jgi:maltose/maltodextrin transport system substrate-binding protein
MIKHILLAALLLFPVVHGLAWTNGKLLIWTTDNRGYRALAELGKKYEAEIGVPVRVEIQDEIVEKVRMAARAGKGPDIFFWAHDCWNRLSRVIATRKP